MDMSEIMRQTPEARAKLLTEQREVLRRLRFSSAEGGLKEVRRFRDVRRTIARLLTAQANRQS